MARPRIWVPGVLYVSDERELFAGRHVGYNGWGKAFSFSPVGHFGSLSDWRHRAWMIERRDLTSWAAHHDIAAARPSDWGQVLQ